MELTTLIDKLSLIKNEVIISSNYDDGYTRCGYIEPYFNIFKSISSLKNQEKLKELSIQYKDKKCSKYFEVLINFGETYTEDIFENLENTEYDRHVREFLQGPVLESMVNVVVNAEYLKVLRDNDVINI
jgi:hypothetical protein